MNMAKYIVCVHEFYQKFLKVVFKKHGSGTGYLVAKNPH